MRKVTQEELDQMINDYSEYIYSYRHQGIKAKSEKKRLIFSKLDLIGLDFRGADLEMAIFIWSNCVNADFTGANLINARFENTLCENAKFELTNCTGANFDSSSCNETNFTNSICSQVNFNECDLRYADFSGACLTNASFKNAALGGVIPTPLYQSVRGYARIITDCCEQNERS